MVADFDPNKNAANLKKHGVSLTEGDGVLNDPLALTVEDETVRDEQRFRYYRNECLWITHGHGSYRSR